MAKMKMTGLLKLEGKQVLMQAEDGVERDKALHDVIVMDGQAVVERREGINYNEAFGMYYDYCQKYLNG